MKRIIIICEGQTEKQFCNDILSPFFLNYDIYLVAPLIKHSLGGIVPWNLLLKQITTHLKSDSSAYVTSFIDYYGIKDSFGFPLWEESKRISDINDRVTALEKAMRNSVDEEERMRFLPYLQLHEFEALLFSNIDIYKDIIPAEDLIDVKYLTKTERDFDNPELINSSSQTSPSHRLERIIKGYDKIVYGTYIADCIGLNRIRERCPRFNKWIENLINI